LLSFIKESGKIRYDVGLTASSLKCGVMEEWGKPTDNDEIVIVGY
jgi:hypothetical protein